MDTVIKRKVSVIKNKKTSSEFSDKILLNFMNVRNKKSLKDLKGKICFRDDYDYKSMRD